MLKGSNVVLIAGGSGAGKSTVAVRVCTTYPAHCALVHVDDYYVLPERAPKLPDGSLDWDDPTSLRFGDLLRDVRVLMLGRPISILTESELYHGSYSPDLGNRLQYEIQPRPVIIVEGHWALYDPEIRALATCRIFLDMPITQSMLRRRGYKAEKPEGYFQQVLVPAHETYVTPTKQHADVVIDMAHLDQDEVFERFCEELRSQGLIP